MPPKRKAATDSSQTSRTRSKLTRTQSGNTSSAFQSTLGLQDDHVDSRRSDSRPYTIQRFALQRNDSQPDSCTGNLTLTISELDVRPVAMASHSLSADSVMTLKQSGNDVAVVHAGEFAAAARDKRLASDNIQVWLQNNKLQIKYPDFKGARRTGSAGLSVMFQLNGDALEVYELLKRAGFIDGPPSNRPQSRADIHAIARAQSSNRALSRGIETMSPLSAFGDRFGTGPSRTQFHTSAASIEDNMSQHFPSGGAGPFDSMSSSQRPISDLSSDPHTTPLWSTEHCGPSENRPFTAAPDFYRAHNSTMATNSSSQPPTSPLRREFSDSGLDQLPPPRTLPFNQPRHEAATPDDQSFSRPRTPGGSLLNAHPLPLPRYSPPKSSGASSAIPATVPSPSKRVFEVGPRITHTSSELDPASYPLSARGLNRARVNPIREDREPLAVVTNHNNRQRPEDVARPLSANDERPQESEAESVKTSKQAVFRDWLALPRTTRERQMSTWWDSFDPGSDPEWQAWDEVAAFVDARGSDERGEGKKK